MEARTKWTLAGFAWGLVAAWAAALIVVGTGAGVFWLYVFGDDPWPAWTGSALTWAAGLVAVLALVAATTAGRLVGRRLERTGSSWAHRGAHVALVGAVLVGAAIGAVYRAQHAESEGRRAAEARAGAYLERLRPAVEVRLEAPGDELRLTATASDAGRGRYEARTALVGDHAPEEPVWARTDTLVPGASGRVVRASVPLDSLRRHFVRHRIGRTGARWAADVELEARLALTPLPPAASEPELGEGAWNGLLLRHPRSSPTDTARLTVTLRSDGVSR